MILDLNCYIFVSLYWMYWQGQANPPRWLPDVVGRHLPPWFRWRLVLEDRRWICLDLRSSRASMIIVDCWILLDCELDLWILTHELEISNLWVHYVHSYKWPTVCSMIALLETATIKDSFSDVTGCTMESRAATVKLKALAAGRRWEAALGLLKSLPLQHLEVGALTLCRSSPCGTWRWKIATVKLISLSKGIYPCLHLSIRSIYLYVCMWRASNNI